MNETVKIIIEGQDGTQRTFDGVENGLAALGNAVVALGGFGTLRRGFDDAVNSSNKLENSLLGLDSIATSFTGDANAATEAAQRLASDGLMSVSDAATGLKNLLATGFSLAESVTLMERFKDSASFGRQAALGFGEAIAGATEGIKNGNSILVDNAGVTKNLSVMLEEMGKSQQDVMRTSQDASVRQALYNGILKETNAQVGDATKLSNTYSGSQARLGTILFTTKARLGDVIKEGSGPMLSMLTQWLSANQQVVVSLALAGGAILGFITILAGGAGLLAAVAAVAAALGGPLTLALLGISVLLGSVVFDAVQKLQGKMSDTFKNAATGATRVGSAAESGFGKADKAAAKLAKQLADIDRNMATAERNFKESLARMILDHENAANELAKQIGDEKAEFAAADEDRKTGFEDAARNMTETHQKKVDDLVRQMDEEKAKGRLANQDKLRDIQQALVDEGISYTNHYAELEKKYEEDKAEAKKKHDEKLAATQAELAQEQAMLARHREDKKLVRGVMLLDEIDMLKRSHSEQMASYARQRQDAISNANQLTNGVVAATNNAARAGATDGFKDLGGRMGKDMANSLLNALKDGVEKKVKDFGWMANDVGQVIGSNVLDLFGIPKAFGGKRARGGQLEAGRPYAVGEEGAELFVPSTNGTLLSNKQSQDMTSSGGPTGGGVTIHQTNHNYAPTDHARNNQELGWMLSNA